MLPPALQGSKKPGINRVNEVIGVHVFRVSLGSSCFRDICNVFSCNSFPDSKREDFHFQG